jgi:hypothetical protein
MNLRIPRRHGHYVFGLIQSGLTCLIAAAIASYPEPSVGRYIAHWMIAWAISWATMLPVVVAAAPVIRALVNRVTSD